MGTWLTVLIIVVVVAVVVALVVRSRRGRATGDNMGLPPMGALGETSANRVSTESDEPAGPTGSTDLGPEAPPRTGV